MQISPWPRHKHASISPLSFLQAGCRSCCPTNSVKRYLFTKFSCFFAFWPTVLYVEPLVQCLVCLSSVTFRIVAKRCVPAKNCLKEWIGNQGQKVDFFDRRHISTSGFAVMATATAVFALFFARTAQQSAIDGPNGLSSSKPCAHCQTVHCRFETGSSISHGYWLRKV